MLPEPHLPKGKRRPSNNGGEREGKGVSLFPLVYGMTRLRHFELRGGVD
ncbi:hypothetical protein PI125_g19826 [Phytophthora idaei]|nr:hypothetical protein PI125_g19826 [Phytophthora idaei]